MAWNSSGYQRPEGIEKSGKDYVAKYGFGHEEWNGNANRIWKGFRVFYTNTTEKLNQYAKGGNLGIIMTAYNGGIPYALGIATSVQANSKEERVKIDKDLNIDAEPSLIWELQSVKKRHRSWIEFEKFWNSDSRAAVNWKCPPSEFQWFESPVPLIPAELFPRCGNEKKSPDIIRMYGRFQPIRPDQAVAIVSQRLPSNSRIIRWLSTGTFDKAAIAKKTRSRPPALSGSAPPASKPYLRYMQQYELIISPRHHALQARFTKFIKKLGVTRILSNTAGVDLQFFSNIRGYVLAEIKPCDKSNARFALRTAIGQLLDYRQRHNETSLSLLVVLEVQPSNEDINLALENGFGISYEGDDDFFVRWPD
jgi:hypothetical protein